MLLKLPKNNEKTYWTKHSKAKMRQYRLSEKRVLRVLRNPERKELGIAPRTIAVMQATGTKKHPTEIWIMYQKVKSKVKGQKPKLTKIISAWRYPGKSPAGEPPPIPEDIFFEIKNELRNSN